MNSIVSQMLGSSVREDVPVPVAARRQPTPRRDPKAVDRQRRTAAALMGMAEGEEDSIIPDDATEIGTVLGVNSLKMGKPAGNDDQAEPAEPPVEQKDGEENGEEMITPATALVAPDLTPKTLEPIDPSEVPARKSQPAPPAAAGRSNMDPMSVLLGRPSERPAASPPPQETTPMTAESAQATMNNVLGVKSANAGLKAGGGMPDHIAGTGTSILEAFSRFAPRH